MRATDANIKEIVDRYSEALYWHIRRLVVSHEDAEDVLQETFVQVFRHLWQLRDSSSLRPWLYRIATNEAVRHLGRRRDDARITEELISRLEASEYVNYDEAAGVKLQKALLTLTVQQRTVFCLKYYDGMEYDEIAYVTGYSRDSLKVSWHNARKKIEQYINEE